MIIGHVRVSTKDQNLDLQIEALQKAGCQKIFQEKISGATKERPELDKMIDQFREGDILVVWKLDRLGHSLKNIIDLNLNKKQVVIKGLTDGLDTSTTNGRLFLNIMASLAEYERELIRKRTKAGLNSARAHGRFGGRPSGLKPTTISKLGIMRKLNAEVGAGPEHIYTSLGLSRATYYRFCKLLEAHSDADLKGLAIKKIVNKNGNQEE